jgi:hypothetical protein
VREAGLGKGVEASELSLPRRGLISDCNWDNGRGDAWRKSGSYVRASALQMVKLGRVRLHKLPGTCASPLGRWSFPIEVTDLMNVNPCFMILGV